jgi:hypothetical protein
MSDNQKIITIQGNTFPHASELTGGHGSQLTGGHGSQLTGGYGSTLCLWWWDGRRGRLMVGYVGEGGIEPDVAYRLDERGKFIRA